MTERTLYDEYAECVDRSPKGTVQHKLATALLRLVGRPGGVTIGKGGEVKELTTVADEILSKMESGQINEIHNK